MTRRRTLLALAGSALAGLAGCATDSGSNPSDETPDTTPTQTPTATPTETPDGSSGENTDNQSDRSEGANSGMTAQVALSTASHLAGAVPVEEFEYQRQENTSQPISAFPAAFADAVRETHDGGFQTDDPSEELLATLDNIKKPRTNIRWSEPVVQLDGNAYVVEPHLPVLELRLGEELLEEYDESRTVSSEGEFEHEEVESLVHRIGWDGQPNTARGSYKRSLVPDEVEAFLDEYDYVEDERGVSRIVVERHNWEPPYRIELREFTEEDRWGQEIHDAKALDDALREFLDSVVASGTGIGTPPFVTDEVPASYFETLASDDRRGKRPLVRVDGRIYRVHVAEGTPETMPVTLTAEPAEPTADGLARFRLQVTVTDDNSGATVAPGEPVELHSGIGLPTALWIEHGDESHLLDSDRYEVPVASEDGGKSWSLAVDHPGMEEVAVSEELSVGDELTATYVVPGTVPAGSYTLSGSFGALWLENPDDYNQTQGVYPFEVELTLTEP